MIEPLLPETPARVRLSSPLDVASRDSVQPSQGLVPDSIHRLQRILGNRELSRLIQAKRLSPSGEIVGLQKKLTIGAADDHHEREADRVAGQVMSMPHATSSVQQQPTQTIQAKSTASTTEAFEAEDSLESRITQTKGSGVPLADPVRGYMEPRFGVDFSQVRVHTGPDATQMNRAVDAQAFTHGSDIYFGEGHGPANAALTAHELTHVVQQAGGVNRQPDNREFVPKISVKPESANVDLGARHEEKLDVVNTHQAPAGTTFHWGGGLSDAAPGLQFLDMGPDKGAHAKLHVKATAPGTHSIQGNFQHQVPGGPEVVTPGPQISLTVPQPGVVTSHFRESASGKGDPKDLTRLAIGDKMVLRFTLSHVKGPGSNIASSVLLSGKGLNTVLKHSEQTWINDQQVDLKFDAVGVGSADLSASLMLGDMTEKQAIVSQVLGQVEMPKQEFLNRTVESTAMVIEATEKATAWMDSLAYAYADAWDNHTKALKDQADLEKLIGDLILGAALAFIPGGIGGVIGKSMANSTKEEAFLCDGIKDLTKWGFRSLAPVALKGGSGGSALTAYPTDPFKWRALKGVRMHTEIGKAAAQNTAWIKAANDSDPNFYLNFNPAQVMGDALKIDGNDVRTLAPVDLAEHALLFEKGFWSEWLKTYGYKVVLHRPSGKYDSRAGRHDITEETGKKVKERCEKIGLDITPYMQASLAAAQAKRAELDGPDRP